MGNIKYSAEDAKKLVLDINDVYLEGVYKTINYNIKKNSNEGKSSMIITGLKNYKINDIINELKEEGYYCNHIVDRDGSINLTIEW